MFVMCCGGVGKFGISIFFPWIFKSIWKSVKTSQIKMSATRTWWARFSVEKQEFLLKLVILTVAAILGEMFFLLLISDYIHKKVLTFKKLYTILVKTLFFYHELINHLIISSILLYYKLFWYIFSWYTY